MSEVRDRTYAENELVDVDGNSFVNCRFAKARLHYAGGTHPNFDNCIFEEAGWYFTGAALRTIQLLQVQNNEDGNSQFITELFRPGFYIGE